jgi:DNA adenine methylase
MIIDRKTKALANWFGSNRTNAERAGSECRGCSHVTIPFFGGGSELPYIDARQLVVNDKHKLMINLAETAANEVWGPKLYRTLRRLAFHPDTLEKARAACLGNDQAFRAIAGIVNAEQCVVDAAAYFVCVWMGRGGKAGTKGELKGQLPIRWNDGGGSSVVRYQSAIRGLLWFRPFLRRCEFCCENAFDVIERVHNKPKHGIYIDAPWPDAGAEYLHNFTEGDQRSLAAALCRFTDTRVVIRFGDHPLIRELYPQPRWTWIEFHSRDQANQTKPEVLILNGPSYAMAV